MSGVARPGRIRNTLLSLGLVFVVLVIGSWLLWLRPEGTAAPVKPSAPQAVTVLYMTMEQPRLLSGTRQCAPLDPLAIQIFSQTQAALAKSRMVLLAALRDPKVAALPIIREQRDPTAWMEKHVRADFKVAPSLLRISISYDTSDPDQLLAIVNAVRSAYLDEVVEKENNERNLRLKQLLRAYSSLDGNVQEKRKELRELTAKVFTDGHSPRYEELLAQDLLDCKKELRRARLDRLSAKDLGEKEKAAMEAKEKFLSDEEKRLVRELTQSRTANVDLETLRREVEAAEQVLRQAMKEIELMKVEAQAPSRVLGVEQAVLTTGD
jgi:hypothetical protein